MISTCQVLECGGRKKKAKEQDLVFGEKKRTQKAA